MTTSGISYKAFYICEINGCKDIYKTINSGYLSGEVIFSFCMVFYIFYVF